MPDRHHLSEDVQRICCKTNTLVMVHVVVCYSKVIAVRITSWPTPNANAICTVWFDEWVVVKCESKVTEDKTQEQVLFDVFRDVNIIVADDIYSVSFLPQPYKVRICESVNARLCRGMYSGKRSIASLMFAQQTSVQHLASVSCSGASDNVFRAMLVAMCDFWVP